MRRTMDDRIILHAKNAFTFTARPTLKVAEYHLLKVLQEFLGEWSWKEKLK